MRSLAFTAALIFVLCWVFDPLWETNDDVLMSMVAHGYGRAVHGSPNLIFSNVLWGYLVRAIPPIDGVLGYSVATIAVLLTIGSAMLYFLLRLGAGYLVSLLVLGLIIAPPTLLPQFTINAGLLTAVAVVGWRVHARDGDLGSLVVSCLLAFCGYLVRWQEFFLVMAVAAPFLPWRALRERQGLQIATLLLAGAIAAAAVVDRWSYREEEWQSYLELDSANLMFLDYGVGGHLKQHPEILTRYGYSENDIDLVTDWFFADPKIANPKSLNGMVAELGPLFRQPANAMRGWAAIRALALPRLLPLLLCCFVFFVVAPRWSVAIAWVVFLVILLAIGIMGRPGVLRIYVPVLSLLLMAPLMVGTPPEGVRRWIVGFTLIAACLGTAYRLISIASAFRIEIHQAQEDLKQLPAGPIVAWGASFPYEQIFPVLANDPNPRRIRLYVLDQDTLAPHGVAAAEVNAGRGMIERLHTEGGVSIVATEACIGLLRTYCREHLASVLSVISTLQLPSMAIWRVTCTGKLGEYIEPEQALRKACDAY